MRKISGMIAAAMIFGALPIVANAEEVEVRISHADLDLSKSADVAILQKRIEAAVTKACTIESALSTQAAKVDRRCVARAKAVAFAQLEDKQAFRVASLER